jgi:hypothetical protein
MPIERKFEKVAPDSPVRCQAVDKQNQCNDQQVEGSKYCPRHNGNMAAVSKAKQDIKNYQLMRWKSQLSDKMSSESIKSLREEIGILRIIMQETMNRCEDAADLIMYSGKIADVAMKIEKLVTSCAKLESSLGLMLDKAAALQLSGEIVDIISRHISDPDVQTKIATEIGSAILGAGRNDV